MDNMNSRPILRALSACLLAALAAAGVEQHTMAGQGAQSAPTASAANVRLMVADARKEIDSFRTTAGGAGAAEAPAIKWDAALWQVHDRAPESEGGTIAAVEAIRLLSRAELWDRAHARVESLDADDPAWERVPSVLYEEGIARKSFEYTVATLSQTAASTKKGPIKSAALLVIGRVHRRLYARRASVRRHNRSLRTT